MYVIIQIERCIHKLIVKAAAEEFAVEHNVEG